jgi:Tfp pilus assembly protein PilV
MREQNQRRCQYGATLAEILVAMLLVVFSMLWGVRTATDAIGAVTDTMYYQRATFLAADINELFTMLPAEHRDNLPGHHSTACDPDNPCTPDEWLDWNIGIINMEVQASLPAGRLEFARDHVTARPSASLTWVARNGETVALAWQPGT